LYQRVQEICVELETVFEGFELGNDSMEVFVPFGDGIHLGLDGCNSFVVDSSGGILPFTVEPLVLRLQKLDDFWNFAPLGKLVIFSIQLFFPAVDHRLELVLAFVGLEYEFVLIVHRGFDGEESLNVFGGYGIKGVALELDLGVLLFLRLFYLELLLLHLHLLGLLALGLSRISSLLLLLLLLLLLFLLFRNLGLFEPLLHQRALLEGHQPVLVEFDLERYPECLLLGVLGLGHEVSDMFVEPSDRGLVLDQDFDGLFASELHCFACRDLSTGLVDIFSLLFRVERRVQTQELVPIHEVPVKLDVIVGLFVEGIVGHLEEGTLDGCHKTAASGH
jgi:hypothetical protein